MLTIPWFVTRTVQDLFRWHPQPPPQPQEESPTSPSQQQKLQQQQQQARLQQQRFQQQQQKPQQGGLQQRQQQQQQQQVQQTSARPGPQSKVPAPITKASPAPATSSPAPQTQARPAPVQNTASSPLQVKPAQKQPNQQNAHANTEPSVKTSTKTLVLTPSASGGKMGEQWAQQQVEKFTFDFDKADKDKSGSLSFSEVYDVLKTVGFKGSEKEAQFIFGHLDKDKNQSVSREEFAAALKNLPRLSIKEFSLRKAFLKMDKDGSGFLTRTEIEDATKTEAGLDIAAEKIADLLVYLCKEDKDKKVSYEEFLRVFGIESTATVMRQIFSKLDADGSGFLTRDEILQAVKSEFELKLQADKIADLVIFLVTDKDKKVSYEEFVDVWLKQKEEKKK